MSWWVLELATNLVLVALVVFLGPLIKRFGRAYAGDIFRGNPRTGKSYLVLMDIAYYLIFVAFILLTMQLEEPGLSEGPLIQISVSRTGGMLLLMGILHGLNVLSLPVIGRLLGLNRQLGDDVPGPV